MTGANGNGDLYVKLANRTESSRVVASMLAVDAMPFPISSLIPMLARSRSFSIALSTEAASVRPASPRRCTFDIGIPFGSEGVLVAGWTIVVLDPAGQLVAVGAQEAMVTTSVVRTASGKSSELVE